MPQYSAPWQALLEPAKTPAFPNPDVNSAMGFDISPDDSAAIAFQKQFQATTFAATDEGKELATSMAKMKLANQLAGALEERKKQLDQQYPELRAVHATPFGTVLGAMSNGDAKVLYQGSPEEREAKMAEIKANIAKNVQTAKLASDPDATAALLAKPGIENEKDKAQTEYYKSLPGMEKARIDVDASRNNLLQKQLEVEDAKLHGTLPGKPMTEAEINEAAFVEASGGFKSTDEAGKIMKLTMMQDTPAGRELKAKWAEAKAKLMRRGSGKSAGQDETPDLSGALNLNLNGVPKANTSFAPTQGGLLDNPQ